MSPRMIKTAAACSPLVSVFDGRTCVGFIYRRGVAGFETFDAEQRSLGIFLTDREALAALPNPVAADEA